MKNNAILYAIVILIILVIVVLAWSFLTPAGAFKGGAPAFDFSLSANPSSETVIQGQVASSTITATLLKGKTQFVQLSVSNCPTSSTCLLSPSGSYPTFYSTLTITTSSGTTVGSYPITINGVGGGKTRSTPYILTVNPIPCTCSAWTNGACGVGGCLATERQQTRTCAPNGCDIQSRCVADVTCCSCNWNNQYQCGGMGCVVNVFYDAWWKKCICSPPGCGNATGTTCDGYHEGDMVCTYNICSGTSDSCSDSDGGIVYNVTGTVTGYKNNSPYNYTDLCPTGKWLLERYCSGTSALSTNYSCTCSNGRCY